MALPVEAVLGLHTELEELEELVPYQEVEVEVGGGAETEEMAGGVSAGRAAAAAGYLMEGVEEGKHTLVEEAADLYLQVRWELALTGEVREGLGRQRVQDLLSVALLLR
jgi:hypothetical protein